VVVVLAEVPCLVSPAAGGGLYVFFAGMAKIDWQFGAILGAGPQAHLFTPADHEVPWTALVVLMLSTNVWYYATNQYINQRCLAARNEWHAKADGKAAVDFGFHMSITRLAAKTVIYLF
jgi:hypothetical protein